MDIQLFLCQTFSCQCVWSWMKWYYKQDHKAGCYIYSITWLPVASEIQASIFERPTNNGCPNWANQKFKYVSRASVFFFFFLICTHQYCLVCSTLIVIKDVREIYMITIPTINIANDTRMYMYVMYLPHHAPDTTLIHFVPKMAYMQLP